MNELITTFVGNIPLRTLGAEAPGSTAVLFYHGLRSSSAAHDGEARSLASAGLTAILVDAPHHGARRTEVIETMPDALTLEGHRVLLPMLREARDEIPRLVDHALGLGHRRVAIAGVSFGAFIALAAATIEPRLAAVVSILGTPDWTPRDGTVPDDLAEAVAESPHLRLEAFPPRPLLLLNAGRDESVRPGPARDFVARLRPLYERTGGGPLVHREYPESEHRVRDVDWQHMWSTAVSFLVESG